MPHVELSLTDAPAAPRQRSSQTPESTLARWAAAVIDADEACFVLDTSASIVATSGSCAELIGLSNPTEAQGQLLRAAADPLVDFTAGGHPLDEAEISQIPPLLAISSGRIARGLVRLACRRTGNTTTLDVVATPVTEGGRVLGSLTFLAKV